VTTPSVSVSGGLPLDAREAAVRKAASDLQGLFVQQLYKTMRESVPDDGGLVEKSQGEEIFAGLMDERLAADTGTRWHRGLGDAIYRALRQKAGLDDAASTAMTTTPPLSDGTGTPMASPVRPS
jgi:peptidoglycan hydrolase FlgJ